MTSYLHSRTLLRKSSSHLCNGPSISCFLSIARIWSIKRSEQFFNLLPAITLILKGSALSIRLVVKEIMRVEGWLASRSACVWMIITGRVLPGSVPLVRFKLASQISPWLRYVLSYRIFINLTRKNFIKCGDNKHRQ